MPLRLITAPTGEPISTEEAKLHLRVTQDTELSLIDGLIVAARELVENETGRAFMLQTWALQTSFPCGRVIELPKPPLVSVSSITYIDTNGDEQTLDGDSYAVSEAFEVTATPDPEVAPPFCQPGRVVLEPNEVWPQTHSQVLNPVTITFTCGYGDDPDLVPKSLIAAMKIKIADLYNIGRESKIVGATVADTNALPALIWPFKVAF